MGKKLCLSAKNKLFAGVCGGFAEFLNVDPTLVRIIWAILGLLTWFILPVILYILCWALMPMSQD